MLIIALVLALIGLVALVFAVVTSNELVAWVCIGASVLGVVLLIIDALRERQRHDAGGEIDSSAGEDEDSYVDYPEEATEEAERSAALSDEPAEEATQQQSAVSAEGRGDDAAK
jgi:threonine/homoserine efflux transporter RhtA